MVGRVAGRVADNFLLHKIVQGRRGEEGGGEEGGGRKGGRNERAKGRTVKTNTPFEFSINDEVID